jgi:hypothetical protein
MAKNLENIQSGIMGILIIGATGVTSATFAYKAYPNTNIYMIIFVVTIAVMILCGKYKKII